MDEVQGFLKDFIANEQRSPTFDDNVHPKIVSNYCLGKEDVYNQVIDWVLHHLENKKCPYHLAVAIAKNTAKQIDAGITEQILDNTINQDKLLNSYALYTQTQKKLSSVCQSFFEQIDEKICVSSPHLFLTSAFEIKNKRRTMEDRCVVHHDLNSLLELGDVPPHSYYAVFDGHSGVDAASYASAHLHVNIAKHPEFLTDTPAAIAQAYKTTDDNFLKKCEEESLKSGCTAVCALVRENKVYLSWAGDSQAVLVKGGRPVLVTDPHKPDRQDERKRVEDVGGCVTHMGVWRVNGILAITRALGDADHRPYISSEPEMATIDLDGTEDFLVLACDGLFDGLSPEEVTSNLYKNISESPSDEPLDAVSAKLVHKAKEQGSEDNITAIVVFLRDISSIRDYATELMSQAGPPQANFFEMNGEGKHDSPCKPTVLELNGTSAKKLKNTANVLSSAGFQCPPVYSDPGFDEDLFRNDHSDFVQQQSRPACFAPEATALSELPTPPIDDIVASQQLVNLSSTELYEGLNSLSMGQSAPVEEETNAFNSGDFESMVNVQVPTESLVDTSASNLTPDEAVDIASSVVSDTIEAAVKCISSNDEVEEGASPVCTTPLNPYAKEFVPGGIQFQSETSETEAKSENVVDVAQSVGEEANSAAAISESSTQDLLPGLISNETVVDAAAKDLLMGDIHGAFNFENVLCQDNGSKSTSISTLTSQFSELSILSPLVFSKTEDVVTEVVNQEIIHDEHANEQTNVQNIQDLVNVSEAQGLDISSPTKSQLTIDQDIGNAVIESNVHETKSLIENVAEVNLLETTPSTVDNNLFMHNDVPQPILPNECNAAGGQIPMQNEINLMSAQHTETNNSDLMGEFVNSKEISSNSVDIISGIAPELEKLKEDDVKPEPIEVVCADKLPSDNSLKTESSSPVKTTAGITPLEQVTFESLNLVGVDLKSESADALLPSDSVEEGPVETVAVDLQTIPVGVPEAEGVTEDIDSDSEKDGGWSYMKGNKMGGSGKSKPETSKSKVEKAAAAKSETTSKLKKDFSKMLQDNKSKVRSLTSTDKTKNPLLEKKTLGVKERVKPTRTTSSTLPRDLSKPNLAKDATKPTAAKSAADKTSKPLSTISRIKKETSSTATTTKVSAVAATTKPTRPTTLRNPVSTAKPATAAKERVPSATAKAANAPTSVGTSRPRSALTANGTKAPTKATTLPKPQPLSQSKVTATSSVRSATLSRPATSTVPTRASSKLSTLSKPTAAESKVKTSTIRKVEPKKPDVKETKDIVNKQILARRNLTASSAAKSETTTKSATATLSNKRADKSVPAKTARSTLLKNDVNKKEVSKTAGSRLTPKANSLLKSSPRVAKSNEKKAPVEETEKSKNPGEIIAAVKPSSAADITPASEEEKFLLEVNDKEIAQENEKNEVNKQNCLENGIAESEKPLDEVNQVECSASNM